MFVFVSQWRNHCHSAKQGNTRAAPERQQVHPTSMQPPRDDDTRGRVTRHQVGWQAVPAPR